MSKSINLPPLVDDPTPADLGIGANDVELEIPTAKSNKKGRPRNGWYDEVVDVIGDSLENLYQIHAEHGNFHLEVKKWNEEKNDWDLVSVYRNLTIDTLPDGDMIGRSFGGGKYQIIARYKDGNGDRQFKSFQLPVGKNYDKYVDEAKQNANSPQMVYAQSETPAAMVSAVKQLAEVAGVGNSQNSQLMDSFLKLAEKQSGNSTDLGGVMDAFAKFAATQQRQDNTPQFIEAFAKLNETMKPAAPPPPQDNSQLFLGMLQFQMNMMQMMMKSQNDTMIALMGNKKENHFEEKLLSHLLENKADPMDKVEQIITLSKRLTSPEKEEDSVVDKVVNAVIEWLPRLAQSTIDAVAVKQLVSHLPEFQQLQENPEIRQRVVDILERKLPADKLEAVREMGEKIGVPLNHIDGESEETII